MYASKKSRIGREIVDIRRLILLLLLLFSDVDPSSSDDDIRFVVTTGFKSSIFGRYKSTGEHCWKNRTCSNEDMSAAYRCVGGADRILKYIDRVRDEGGRDDSVGGVFAIDAGNYFEGPTPLIVFDDVDGSNDTTYSIALRSNRTFVESRKNFVRTGYDAWGLADEDFVKISSSSSNWMPPMGMPACGSIISSASWGPDIVVRTVVFDVCVCFGGTSACPGAVSN